MKVIRYPSREDWHDILRRPSENTFAIEQSVRPIVEAVKRTGDTALRELTYKLDKIDLDHFAVSEDEFDQAASKVPNGLKAAITIAKANIEKFHVAQRETVQMIETSPGVLCWRRSVAIERVGLYVPAGTAPLFSTVLMLGVPAKFAGCREIVLCSPPDTFGKIDDTILYTATLCGIKKIFKVGGAHAIAAMAYGTDSIPKVDKIFGPGNSYVTMAKQIVSSHVAIDMPAGPSEVAVLADDSCVPEFVAADLLSQAEHGADSQVMLIATSEDVINAAIAEIARQVETLPRRDVALSSLSKSRAILVKSLEEGVDLLNEYAAEHLILAVENADEIAGRVINAGSVFIGNYSCESAGDYASGTNHTLPTAGFARSFSGVSLDSFVKKITFQKLSIEGLQNIGPAIEAMSVAEGLEAHRRAVTYRLEKVNVI